MRMVIYGSDGATLLGSIKLPECQSCNERKAIMGAGPWQTDATVLALAFLIVGVCLALHFVPKVEV